jgi:hypothetical protein
MIHSRLPSKINILEEFQRYVGETLHPGYTKLGEGLQSKWLIILTLREPLVW